MVVETRPDDVGFPDRPWRKSRKTSSPRQPLSRELIVEAGLRILDAEGLDALSMRRVAQKLGTGPASLYAHMANKDELLELVYDRILGEIRIPEPDPEHWRARLRELALESFRVLTAHADIAKVALTNIPTTPNALRTGEGMLAIMLVGGLPPRIAAWGADRLSLYISADACECSPHRASQREAGEMFGQIRDFYTNLPPDRFPLLSGHVDVMMNGGGHQRFEFGLDLILDGLAKYVQRP
ncbi:TetR/AcrR family transcriptional regulator C-terminal domain-containing protein [Nonomuraea dietziae]|uniref:TetR/AcrR family transcriptional regulator C-terminal domain-containing protein n=1 Tax=Nonomuraea dietziae TaxID=65515 RepID=UPI0034439886